MSYTALSAPHPTPGSRSPAASPTISVAVRSLGLTRMFGRGEASVTALAEVDVVLGRNGRLNACEASPRLAAVLEYNFRGAGLMNPDDEQVGILPVPVEMLPTGRKYDVVVYGLPYGNFNPAEVREIIGGCLGMLRPGGALTYFAYRGLPTIWRLVSSRAALRRHRQVTEVLARTHRRHVVGRTTVWANLPPARVWTLRTPASSDGLR